MPTSNETRVRVEGFSKISARVRAGERARSRSGQRAAGTGIAGALEPGGEVQHPPQGGRIEIAQVEEVPGTGGRLRARPVLRLLGAPKRAAHVAAAWPAEGRQRRARAVQHRDGRVDVAVGHHQRRGEPQHVVPGGDREQPLGGAGGLHLAVPAARHFSPSSRPRPRASSNTAG